MADVIKTGNYTKKDIRVSLKRKIQNAGLFIREGASVPPTDEFLFAGALIDMYLDSAEDIIYVSGDGGAQGEMQKYSTDFKTAIDSTFLQLGSPPADGTCSGLPLFVVIKRNSVFMYGQQAGTLGDDYIQVFEKDTGNLANAFGQAGVGNGEFTNGSIKTAAVFDSLDNIIIIDRINNRIQFFNMGRFFGEVGTAAKQYENVACDSDGNIYVTDSTDNLIRKFTKALAIDSTWAHTDGRGIVVDDTYVYAADDTNLKIVRYSKVGAGGTDIITGLTTSVGDIDVDDNYIAVADASAVEIYNKSDYSLNNSIGVAATGLALYNNQIYLVFNGTGKLTRYNIDGTGETDIITGMTNPLSLTIADDGFIYITFANDTCKKYTLAGVECVTWGSTGVGNGQFTLPNAIAYNQKNDGVIVVDQKGDSRIEEFQYGKFIQTYGTAGAGNLNFGDPIDITIDADDNTYVVDLSNNRVIKHDSSFAYIDEVAINDLSSIGIQLTQERLYVGTNPSSAGVIRIYDLDFNTYDILPVKQDGFDKNRECDKVHLFDYALYAVEETHIQQYNIKGNYESVWTDITRFLDMTSNFEIAYTSDETNFSLGKYEVGTLELNLRNDNDKFAIETNNGSIFFDSDRTYQRNLSKIKIELNDNNIFEGFIDGKNVKYEQNFVKLSLFANIKYLDNMKSENFGAVVSDGDTISEIIDAVINTLYLRDFITYNAADIEIFRDVVINDFSDLPEFILDVIGLFASFGKFSFGIYNGDNFYAYSFIGDAGDGSTNVLDARTLDYIITQNNLLDKPVFNTGEHRLFRTVVIEGDGKDGNYEIEPSVYNIYNESREVKVTSDSITTQPSLDNIAADYQFLSVYPSKEIEIIIPLQIPADGKIYDKQFAFNIFDTDGDRGLNINDPALLLGNSILPAKETALDDNDSGERVLYRVLGWKHKIGSEMITEIKIKEMIADDV